MLIDKVRESWSAAGLSFAAAILLVLGLSGGIKVPLLELPSIGSPSGLLISPEVLIGGAVIVAFLVVVLVLRSRARFFIAATGIVASQIGFLVFDAVRFAGLLPQLGFVKLEIIRTPDWRVQIGMIILATALYFLDHVRRPPS